MKTAMHGRVMQRPDFTRDGRWCQLVTRWFRGWPAPAKDYDGDFEPMVIDDFLASRPGRTWTVWVSKLAILAVERLECAPRRNLSTWESNNLGTIARLIEAVGSNFEVWASELEEGAWFADRFEFQGHILDSSYWRFMTVMRLFHHYSPGVPALSGPGSWTHIRGTFTAGASPRFGASWMLIDEQKFMGIDGDSFRLILPVEDA